MPSVGHMTYKFTMETSTEEITMSKSSMTWNQRFAIIDAHKPSDEQICSAFGIQQNELDTARQLRNAGQFIPSTDIDVDAYATMFTTPTTGATSTKRPTKTASTDKPITATKKTKEPKKRGRKGDKIKNAFSSIPTDPIPAEPFAKQHDVSLTVLRQSKRFDTVTDGGKVHVKKVAQADGTKVLSIWRDAD